MNLKDLKDALEVLRSKTGFEFAVDINGVTNEINISTGLKLKDSPQGKFGKERDEIELISMVSWNE
jgi:hypothetical protein